MSKVIHYFSLAAEAAKQNVSTHCSKHGAILVKGGKVVGTGFNSIDPHPSMLGYGKYCHAEIAAIKDYLSRHRGMRSKLSFQTFYYKQGGLYKVSETSSFRGGKERRYEKRSEF